MGVHSQSINSNYVIPLSTNAFNALHFTNSSVVDDIPQKTRVLSNDDISYCITTVSSLKLTIENEITISYSQLKRPVVSQVRSKFATPNVTVKPFIPEYQGNSSQSVHKVRDGHKLVSSRDHQIHNVPEMAAGSCSVSMHATAGNVLSVLFLNHTCSRDNQVYVHDSHDGWSTTLDGCSPWKSPGYDVTTAGRSALMVFDFHDLDKYFSLEIQIKALAVQMTDGFITRYVSPVLGYIQTPGWHPFAGRFNAGVTTGTATVVVPLSQLTLISVVYSYIRVPSSPHETKRIDVSLFTVSKDRAKPRSEWKIDRKHLGRPGEALLTDLTDFRVDFREIYRGFFHGIRVLFSFHQPLSAPQRHPEGLWNCSVPFWPEFYQHFVCNIKTECSGQEDEIGCPDASCQQGGVLLNERCYVFIRLSGASWHHANTACRQMGAALASFPTVNSWYHLAVLSQTKKHDDMIYIGLHSPDASFAATAQHIITCPDQYWTQDFLACDAYSACWHDYDVRSSDVHIMTDNAVTPTCVDVDGTSSFTAMFPCQNSAGTVSYSLVCNHLQDCADNSDEDFCVFPPCSAASQYKCVNGQCLRAHQHCDEFVQCLDGSDESDCVSRDFERFGRVALPRPPAVADFDGRGWMVYTPLTPGWMERGAPLCPDTHVFCPGDGYCLPVYVRCNGMYDCPGREDEFGCDSYTCPGLYRCRGLELTCLHPDHLCNGWPQCPQHDDELFCNLTCPAYCTCLGHAFTCSGDFLVELFFRLRYLDAGGSGLEPWRLAFNLKLVYLSLANCDLVHLGNVMLPNLLSLDVSDNMLTDITVNELKEMMNLRNLSLARNPFSTLFSGNSFSSLLVHENILHVDVSGVGLKVLDMPRHLPFPSLLSLNLSGSGVAHLIGDGFRSLASLRTLDLRGCPMTEFPRRAFKHLKDLRLVFANNYKLCCRANLPEGFNVDNCQAPFNEISSCDALLRADVYRVCLSVLAALALSGNLGCFCLRIFSLTGRGKTGFSVFVTHLCMSDFVMGVYMAMIGVADRIYLGKYLWEDARWRHSTACKVAGVLALLSSEVSAFIICLITLDRFLVIRFPFSRLRFSSFSAQVTSLLTWTVGVVLVTVPFLPLTAYTHFYSQTGICVPLPITRNDFAGQHYAFGVMILLNLVVFLIIATGQISVYLSMTSNAMSSIDTNRKSRDLIVARRLITVVVSDFLCWFPLGLLGVLAAQGVPVPGEVNVAMAIFVLPLNSALNPFLYTLNMIREKRQRVTEMKLLKMITDLGISDNDNLRR